ncbi:MAG: hypothetical protein AB7V26_09150 [Lysobacterales bacterium]
MTPTRRISIILSSLVTVLGSLGVAQSFGLGEGYRLLPTRPLSVDQDVLAQLDHEPFKLESWGEYASVLEHPLFNEDRQPTPVEAVAGADADAEPAVPPINVTLTSIILTPTVKLAIVRDKASGKSQVVKLGTPLDGEQSGWKLVEVNPRMAIFEGQGMGRQNLELDVADKGPSGGAGAAAPGTPAAPQSVAEAAFGVNPGQAAAAQTQAQPAPAAGGAQDRAEEIRKRIEERRKQLREEAERMRSEESKQ